MKRITNFGLALAACSALILSGCSKDPVIDGGKANGKEGVLKVSLEKNDEYQVITKAEPSLSDMSVTITKEGSGEVVHSWSSYDNMNSDISLPAGNYVISAQNCDPFNAEFDKPRFAASKSFEVVASQTCQISLVAMHTKVKTSINFDAAFLAAVSDVSVVVSNGNGILEFTSGETRPGFFKVPADGKLTVTVNCKRKSDNQPIQQAYTISQVEARQWHKINISLSTSGSATPGITIDSELIEKDYDIDIPGNDIIDNNGDNGQWGEDPDPDPVPGIAPSVVGASYDGSPFDIDQIMNIVIPQDLTEENVPVLDVQINAPEGGIQKLEISIISDLLTPEILEGVGIGSEFDIANLDPASSLAQSLEMLGLVNLAVPIKDQPSYMFSIGQFMPMLAGLQQMLGEDCPHSFRIKVTDGLGNTATKTLTVKVSIEE